MADRMEREEWSLTPPLLSFLLHSFLRLLPAEEKDRFIPRLRTAIPLLCAPGILAEMSGLPWEFARQNLLLRVREE